MAHNCATECNHNLQYCSHCKKVYCTECTKEWEEVQLTSTTTWANSDGTSGAITLDNCVTCH